MARVIRRPPHNVLVLTLALLVALASACASRDFKQLWNDRYIVAARAHDQGRYDEAEAHYAQLLEHAPDDETRRLALYQRALLAEDRGERDLALERYEEIWGEEIFDEHGARAMSRAARMLEDEGQRGRAFALRRELTSRYPDTGAAERALRQITRRLVDAEGPEAAAAQMLEIAGEVEGRDLEDYLYLELGKLRREHLDDPYGAIEAFERVIALDMRGTLADDAIWEIANIHRERKEWGPALRQLDRLVKGYHEKSWFIGDYNSEYADEACFDSGLIYRDELQDYDNAAKYFERFIREFPHSRLRDDAAWHLVEIERLRGDQRAYERALSRFVEDYPESRHARVARQLLEERAR